MGGSEDQIVEFVPQFYLIFLRTLLLKCASSEEARQQF